MFDVVVDLGFWLVFDVFGVELDYFGECGVDGYVEVVGDDCFV